MANRAGGIMSDSQVKGGEGRRQVDVFLSENLGGYRAENNGGKLSCYGKYVEPVFHAAEHAYRGLAHDNPHEIARAKDELRSVGKGLNAMDHTYQTQAQKKK